NATAAEQLQRRPIRIFQGAQSATEMRRVDIDPVVEGPLWRVRESLRGTGNPGLSSQAESGVEDANQVRPAVTVAIFVEREVRHIHHEHAAIPRRDAAGEAQALAESCGVFESTVIIPIFQKPDPCRSQVDGLRGTVVTAHLDDEDSPLP